ncbi:site-specific tyrosine recombinase XerD [soil metagenome]
MVAQRARWLDEAAALPLRPMMAEFTATFGVGWGPVTRRKHRDDFERFLAWLEATGVEPTTDALSFATLAAYVDDLRRRPKVRGVWRGSPDALAHALAAGPTETLSANSVNAYVRPLRSLVIWALDEGYLASNPFRRFRRRAALDPLLPSEETPTQGATLGDLRALEAGCAGGRPRDLRDRAIVAILVTTAARNSSVRLLRLDDVDAERSLLRVWRGKGGKTLLVALHPDARTALERYLATGRPALVAALDAQGDPGYLFPSERDRRRPLGMNALSLMLTRRYHAGGGTLPYFGSHRIRHGTATLLANNGMPLEELSRFMGHASTQVTRRYAVQTPDALGERAAEALARAGLAGP